MTACFRVVTTGLGFGSRVCLVAIAACAIFVIAGGAYAQDRPLAPVVRADLPPGVSETYAVTANAGDLVLGPFNLTAGGPLKFEVFGPELAKLKAAELENGEQKIGFVAPVGGTYRVRFTAGGKAQTSFSWTTTVVSPAKRMGGFQGTPIVSYESPRISRLAKDIKAGVPDALSRFWAEIASNGAPLVEGIPSAAGAAGTPAEELLVTFLWREIYETYSVEVLRPPQGPRDYRLMTHLVGTDVWYKTMKVHRTTRFLYRLAPNRRTWEEDGNATLLIDPLNPRRFPEERDQWIGRMEIESDPAAAWSSVLSLPDAPDESWVWRTPPQRGTLVERTFDSPSLNARLNLHIYTPPGYAPTQGRYPLVALFDGTPFAKGMIAAPTTLDNLIADGRIRPPIVVFIDSITNVSRNRGSNLTSPAFVDSVATDMVPWMRTMYPISPDPKDNVIGGSSAGAVGAALTALRHPEVFGNVLAMSGGAAVSDLYIASPRVPVRFYIDIGLYEIVTDLPFDELILTEGQTVRNRRFRDILLAKGYEVIYRETGTDHEFLHWRATLAEALMTLLKPRPER